jgi:hypothetical protein
MKCPVCDGDGWGIEDIGLDDGSGPRWDCNYCNSSGEAGLFRYLSWRFFSLNVVMNIELSLYEWWYVNCPTCNIDQNCPTCFGNGFITRWQNWKGRKNG